MVRLANPLAATKKQRKVRKHANDSANQPNAAAADGVQIKQQNRLYTGYARRAKTPTGTIYASLLWDFPENHFDEKSPVTLPSTLVDKDEPGQKLARTDSDPLGLVPASPEIATSTAGHTQIIGNATKKNARQNKYTHAKKAPAPAAARNKPAATTPPQKDEMQTFFEHGKWTKMMKHKLYTRQKRCIHALQKFYDTSPEYDPYRAAADAADRKRQKSPPSNPVTSMGPPLSPAYWTLEQLQRGKTVVHSCHALAAYLSSTPGEDTGTDMSYDSEDRRVQRRLRKVQLHGLYETLRDLFTITEGQLVEGGS